MGGTAWRRSEGNKNGMEGGGGGGDREEVGDSWHPPVWG